MIIKKVMPKIPVAKKRVAAYCRVSTFRNEQDESFETQQKYYEELIQSHPDWELVKVYLKAAMKNKKCRLWSIRQKRKWLALF